MFIIKAMLVVWMATSVYCISRSISEIRYRFTPCGQDGRTGPSDNMCMTEYANTNILAEENRFFMFDDIHSGVEEYRGAQGFNISQAGRYNITLAGAAGGRGICNTDYGRGLIWKGQVDLTTEDQLLILVGQKGASPCNTTDYQAFGQMVCTNPPKTETESLQCNQTWYQWVSTVVSAQNLERAYSYSGGGGGGGASMLRLINRTTGEAFEFPIAVAGGGGGSSVIASYDIINSENIVQSTTVNATSREKYRFFMDAKSDNLGMSPGFGFGVRGLVTRNVSTNFRAGTGGGYSTRFNSQNSDGGFLNALENFSEGGFDCARQRFDLYPIDLGTNLNGGFGGGGGQCGGGGSGGGFTGGGVFGDTLEYPGQGGFYYFTGQATLDTESRNVTEIGFGLNELTDGYVEVVLANCGCTGDCHVNEDEQTFECSCPENDTHLAQNGFDCVKDIVQTVNVSVEASLQINNITFTPLYIEESVQLFGVAGIVHIEDENFTSLSSDDHSTSSSCCVVFLGPNSEAVLSSNIVRETNGEINQLSIVSTNEEGTFTQSEYHSYLTDSVVVTGGLIVSKGGCALYNMEINVTVSTVRTDAEPFTADSLQQMNQEGLFRLAQSSLQLVVPTTTAPTTVPPFSTHPSISSEQLLTWSLSGLSGLLLLLLIVFIAACVYKRSKKRLKSSEECHRPICSTMRSDGTASMATNQAYMAYNEPNIYTRPSSLSTRTMPTGYVPARLLERIEQPNYEFMGFSGESDLAAGIEPSQLAVAEGGLLSQQCTFNKKVLWDAEQTPITSSAKYFAPKYGVSAPIHDFTSYNRQRVGSTSNQLRHQQTWEYPRSKLIYMRELGEGQFGKVLLMRANGIANYRGLIPVAVKTLSSRATHMLEKFVQETNLMKKFCHPNIVSLLGVSSHDVNEDSAPLMILEYMPFGDLHSFLRNHKPSHEREITLIGPAHFFSVGRDVVDALSFLASQGYVHRDVAARNCLVGPDLHIKIADFGLSRAVQSKSYYRVEGKSVLPVRWMAPESLLYGLFSTASDIWSFGVLMWEVVTFGELPLKKVEPEDIIRMADNKTLFHSRPVDCPDEIHEVICECHQHEAKDRIAFDRIRQTFSKDNIHHYFEESSVQI